VVAGGTVVGGGVVGAVVGGVVGAVVGGVVGVGIGAVVGVVVGTVEMGPDTGVPYTPTPEEPDELPEPDDAAGTTGSVFMGWAHSAPTGHGPVGGTPPPDVQGADGVQVVTV
jgi:hypothetical protein